MALTVTPWGFILIPLALSLWFVQPSLLLPVCIFTAVIPAVSVLNVAIGDYIGGLSAFYFVAILMMVRLAFASFRIRRLLPATLPETTKAMRPLLLFWAWASISAFLLPALFRGTVVLVPRAGIPDLTQVLSSGRYGEALHWTMSNLAQVVFLSLDIGIVIYAARSASVTSASRAVKALRLGVVVVGVVALMQVIAYGIGWNFPSEVFNSNPTWSQLYSESLGGFRRVSATFSEPSDAGGFLAAAFMGLLAEFVARKRMLSIGSVVPIVCVLIGLLWTTASTGYVTAAVGLVGMFFVLSVAGRKAESKAASVVRCLQPIGIGFAVIALAFSMSPRLSSAASSMTIGKIHTGSFVARLLADAYSIRILANTYGLGVGLGSNRPSSMITYLLSNVGIAGTLLFGWFIARLLSGLAKIERNQKNRDFSFVLWLSIGWLVAQMVAIPDPTFPPLWAIIATVMTICSGYGKPMTFAPPLPSCNPVTPLTDGHT